MFIQYKYLYKFTFKASTVFVKCNKTGTVLATSLIRTPLNLRSFSVPFELELTWFDCIRKSNIPNTLPCRMPDLMSSIPGELQIIINGKFIVFTVEM